MDPALLFPLSQQPKSPLRLKLVEVLNSPALRSTLTSIHGALVQISSAIRQSVLRSSTEYSSSWKFFFSAEEPARCLFFFVLGAKFCLFFFLLFVIRKLSAPRGRRLALVGSNPFPSRESSFRLIFSNPQFCLPCDLDSLFQRVSTYLPPPPKQMALVFWSPSL